MKVLVKIICSVSAVSSILHSVFNLSFNITEMYTESSRSRSCKTEFQFFEVVLRVAIVARQFRERTLSM